MELVEDLQRHLVLGPAVLGYRTVRSVQVLGFIPRRALPVCPCRLAAIFVPVD
jgi:hypothetical protein